MASRPVAWTSLIAVQTFGAQRSVTRRGKTDSGGDKAHVQIGPPPRIWRNRWRQRGTVVRSGKEAMKTTRFNQYYCVVIRQTMIVAGVVVLTTEVAYPASTEVIPRWMVLADASVPGNAGHATMQFAPDDGQRARRRDSRRRYGRGIHAARLRWRERRRMRTPRWRQRNQTARRVPAIAARERAAIAAAAPGRLAQAAQAEVPERAPAARETAAAAEVAVGGAAAVEA
jgi:hypothetical protein